MECEGAGTEGTGREGDAENQCVGIVESEGACTDVTGRESTQKAADKSVGG